MKITPWITAAVLAFGLSPTVQAQYRGYSYGQPDSGRYGTWNGDRAYTLAQEVNRTSSWIYRQAMRNNRRPDRGEARALEALYQLNVASSHFQGEIGSYRRDPRHTANDFARLVSAYDNAAEAVRWIRQPYIDRGMDRIAESLTQMSPFYGRSYDRYQGRGRDWDRHDQYDRDRDGRYDRNRDQNDDGDGYRPPVR